jgi:predicted neuraminidase
VLNAFNLYPPGEVTPACHAASLVETAGGDVLAAWFGGAYEGASDVAIYLARFSGQGWGVSQKIAAREGVPLWNPVLFRAADGILWLFYKAGPTIPAWTGCYLLSRDDGRSWSAPTALPAGLLGPAKNKPITLSNGDILSPTSAESWRSWSAWVELSRDGGLTWTRRGPITAPPAPSPSADMTFSAKFRGIIQPAVWESSPDRLRMVLRSTRAVGWVCLSDSEDGGQTWTPTRASAVPNPNSGLDAVRLASGRVVLACNPVHEGRSPLSLLVSNDNGETWPERLDLEDGPGEYSYPSILQSRDGKIHLVFTYRRETIRHVILAYSPA